MSEIDLSLPESIPEMSRYSERPMTLDSFALYNLVDPETKPPDLIEECHAQCPRDDYIYLKTAHGITSLRSLIDFHLTTTVSDGFDPNLFLIVTNPNWQQKGITIITLGDDEGKPDIYNIKAEDSGIVLINLQIGNTDWYEAKEGYERVEGSIATDTQPGEMLVDAASSKKPPTGFHIAIYAIPGINPSILLHSTSPLPSNPPEKETCRFEGFLNPSRDLMSQAIDSFHPGTCMSNRWICKMYFLIADSTEYEEKGLILCGVKERKTQRVGCKEAVERICGIVRGMNGWDEV